LTQVDRDYITAGSGEGRASLDRVRGRWQSCRYNTGASRISTQEDFMAKLLVLSPRFLADPPCAS